ncbi:MAG TPA: S41 family peptidase [Burkholderiaceae bacterium]|nr:S41 family peptidase [Burkholderiaceae bacterium]
MSMNGLSNAPAAGAASLTAAERGRRCARLFVLAGLVGLGSCGGGNSSSPAPSPIPYTPGVYPPSATFAARCATPRSGTDPFTGIPYPDVQGSTLAENNWLRSWTNELYLWYSEVPDLNPGGTSTTAAYFALLKTSATTPSGQPKDRFHFTYPTSAWEALSQSGVQAGYGAAWDVIAATPPRDVEVAYVEPGSPATAANLARGARVLAVDGVDMVNAADPASVDTLNAGLFPASTGEVHAFSVLDAGATTPRTVTMNAAKVTETPVTNVAVLSGTTVGYMLFKDHIATAEQELVAAVTQLKAQGITDLVLDIRYNGGGYLDIASELAYMIAGPTATAGKTFELTVYNNKYPVDDPFTGMPITPLDFHSTAQGFSVTQGTALPALNLSRVFVLTGPDTCSASESIMNSLRGIGVNVYQFGSTTCGKPYGFFPADNCGTTYFSIQFKGVNQAGFGDYPDGFSPANTQGTAGVSVPGCSVADDMAHALGDPNEAQLASALAYLASPGACPAPTGSLAQVQSTRAGNERGSAVVPKSPWHQNRIYRR